MNKLKFLPLAPVIVLLFFCGIIRHDVDEKDYAKLASQKQFDGVGEVFINNEFVGSCVWIRDRFALSAAHLFIAHDFKKDTLRMDGHKIVVNVPVNPRLVSPVNVHLRIRGKKFVLKKINIHPTYLDTSSQGACDLVVLELEQPVKDLPMVQVNERQDELGSTVVGVGFGVFGVADKANEPDEKTVSRKIAGQNTIDSIGGDSYQKNFTLLLSDFDHPTRSDCNKMGSSKPLPLEYICSGGDSGGGLFRQINGNWELIAICSGASTNVEQLLATGYYGQVMEWTRLSVFSEWIKSNTK